MKKSKKSISSIIVIVIAFLVYNYQEQITNFVNDLENKEPVSVVSYNLENIPAYSGKRAQ